MTDASAFELLLCEVVARPTKIVSGYAPPFSAVSRELISVQFAPSKLRKPENDEPTRTRRIHGVVAGGQAGVSALPVLMALPPTVSRARNCAELAPATGQPGM